MSFTRYCAVVYQTDGSEEKRGPILVGMDSEDRPFILNRYSYVPFQIADITVIKEYLSATLNDDTAYEQFYQDFPPTHRIQQSPGWLAPDGKFYPCRYFEHDILAGRLSKIYYGTSRSDGSLLEAHNWLRLDYTGFVKSHIHYEGVTQAQIETLSDLCFHADTEYARNLAHELDNILEFQGDQDIGS